MSFTRRGRIVEGDDGLGSCGFDGGGLEGDNG